MEKTIKIKFGEDSAAPCEPCECGSRRFTSWEKVVRGYTWDLDEADEGDWDGDEERGDYGDTERIEWRCADCDALILDKAKFEEKPRRLK